MTCERLREILDAYIDDEVAASEVREIEDHLRECPACGREVAGRRALREALAAHLTYHRAPAALRERLVESLPIAGRDAASGVSTPTLDRAPGRSSADHTRMLIWWRRTALSLAACLAFVSVVLLVEVMGRRTSSDGTLSAAPALAEFILTSHLRSLENLPPVSATPSELVQSSRLLEVASSSKHEVRPWFAGKLAFAPAVPDLEGFSLLGGRLDMIGDQPAAALVYRRDKHIINLFVWPRGSAEAAPVSEVNAGAARGASGFAAHSLAGYHEVEFSVPEFHCWAVSDVEPEQLLLFARAYHTAVAP